MPADDPFAPAAPVQGAFPNTRWSVVLLAGADSSPDARSAFGRLYSNYQPALLGFLRRQGRTEDEAADIVQGFFEYLLGEHRLQLVRREGRFRCWLLACLKNYQKDAWRKKSALKRGGGRSPTPLQNSADGLIIDPPHPGRTPEQEFDHQYALAFLASVLSRLEQQYVKRERLELFRQLQPFLLEKKDSLSHAALGQRLGFSEGRVNTEVCRLRRRFRKAFDEKLAELVSTPEELTAEKQILFAALSTP